MKTVVEPLEGNKVKLSVEVDEAEFEKALDSAFRKIAREVRVPGFRPGKAPRRLLEARIGIEAARQEALRDSLPAYYADAVRDSDLDVIAPPEIDITAGEENGPIAFDAVVEIRPQVSVLGYGGLRVTLPSPEVSDDDVRIQIDRMRNQFGELRVVDRPVADGDHVTLSINARKTGEDEPIYDTDDELYEAGSRTLVPELDVHLRGSKVGDILTFSAPVPGGGEGDELAFRVLVKEVKEKILPEVTDEWASEASEFDTVAELEGDVRNRMATVRRVQAQLALRDETLKALVELVDDDVPKALVAQDAERRIHDLAHRLEAQGASIPQYLEATGTSQEELLDGLKAESVQAVKADLALRAVADAEGLEATDEDVDDEIDRLAKRFDQKPAQLRRQLEQQEALATVRSDVRKSKALEWLIDSIEVVDEEGQPIDRLQLSMPAPEAPAPAPAPESEEESETEA